MDPFLCSTIALESEVVKSRFCRFDGARFLNDVGREVSAFLGKSSRELTFNCPCNTIVLPRISFMFIRRGVLMVGRYSGILMPAFAPASAPHIRIASVGGNMWGHCYESGEDTLYILRRKEDTLLLYVYSLAQEVDPPARIITVDGMLNHTDGHLFVCRREMTFVSGRLYLACSGPALEESSSDRPISPIVCEKAEENECVLSTTYYIGNGEWLLHKLQVSHRGRKVSAQTLSSWLLGPDDTSQVEYQILRKNLLLLCSSGDTGFMYYHSLCDGRGRELGARRGQANDLEPEQTLVADDGTIYIKSELALSHPMDCVHAFYPQGRQLMYSDTPNWFFDSEDNRANPAV
ncbi:hypothetical protein FOZ60_017160 [Perkinsus olseni]|uniref:Uncharacterized protein n=1 Tax=Perkinsus olseni TaxID=32597 RepID=A0A7J6N2H6_PEROL|nr:hypothetical protein FOZ60_017160 [Perkinsus olseni]